MAGNFLIPPRPSILIQVQDIVQQSDPEISQIASLIRQDVSLYAILLSSVNSPWLGLSQAVESVEQAITLLGINKVVAMLRAVMVRSCFEACDLLESFWTTATQVGSICQHLAKRFENLGDDSPYSVGMLHNSGIPIMLSQFEQFSEFLAVHGPLPARDLCLRERQQFDTDHYLQGALLAAKWCLPEAVVQAVRYQPIAHSVLSGEKSLSHNATTLLALLTLAKSISDEYRLYWQISSDDQANINGVNAALDYLQLAQEEYNEIKEDLLDDLAC